MSTKWTHESCNPYKQKPLSPGPDELEVFEIDMFNLSTKAGNKSSDNFEIFLLPVVIIWHK